MSTQDSVAGYAYWISQDESTKVIYSLAVASDIDAMVNDGYRRIPHGGVESGGFLFGTRNNGVAKIEAFQPIDCQHAFGPSFILSDRDLENMRTQLRAAKSNDELAGLRPLGWFLGHTRSPFEVSERELTWFNEFFPEPGGLILLVKPERFQATRFSVLVRDAAGVLERDGNRSSFILPLSGQSGPGKSPSPSIPAPEKTAPPPPPSQVARPAVPPSPQPSLDDGASDPEKTGPLPPPPFSDAEPLRASPTAGMFPRFVPGSEEKQPLAEAQREKSAPLPTSPFRKTSPSVPETTAPLSSAEGQRKGGLDREPARSSELDIPKPMGGQVTRIHSMSPAAPPASSAETRPISPQRNVVAPSSGSSPKAPPPSQTAAEDPKLAYPYASLAAPTRVRATPRKNVETFGWRSAAVLLLAAVLGCVAGYWAYLQLPSPVIPVSVREQRGQFIVEWPSAQTDNVDYAALQVNEGQWVTLTSDEKSAGRALITPPATGDLKIDLLAKHWLRDSRGIVRYIRTPR